MKRDESRSRDGVALERRIEAAVGRERMVV
jgi:hypothetical protein